MRRPRPVPSEPAPCLGILLASGTHNAAHAAFVLATGAAAMGREVTVFATNAGCRALLADPAGLDDPGREARVEAAGVAGLAVLLAAAAELGVRLMVCASGLRAEGLEGAVLAPGVEVTGIASFLGAVGSGQIVGL